MLVVPGFRGFVLESGVAARKRAVHQALMVSVWLELGPEGAKFGRARESSRAEGRELSV